MTWLLLVRPEAERDLANARDWYDQKIPGLGDEFLDEIARAIHELELNPTLSRFYFLNFRRVLLRRFPYKLFYQIVGDRVIIFRVIHARENHPSKLSHLA